MGVPAFFRWLSRKYPSVIVECIEQRPVDVDGQQVPVDSSLPNPNGVEFDNLYLDMNGIIHPCTHPEDKPAPKDEDEMMIAIFECIDRLFRIVRPRKLLYMAIDGVAPRAKMNQQRSRRFRASKETQEKIDEIARIRSELQAKGAYLPPEKPKEAHFDSNCITPGTPFMDRLSKCLHYYIHDRLNNDPGWKGVKVILSDANVPGEGEHKIMDYIRRQRAQPDHDPNTQHVLCGADADLIMLGLATHEPNFTIIREEFKPNKPRPCDVCGQLGHEMKECTGTTPEDNMAKDPNMAFGNQDSFIFVRLSVLREYLERELQMPNLPFPYDFERALDDWVFMCFFVGNDFLPHLPSLEIREGAVDRLVNLYKKCVYKTRGWLTDSGDVNLERVQVIMSELGLAEDEIFKRRQQNEINFKNREKAKKRREQQQRPNFNLLERTQFAPTPIGQGPQTVQNARQEAANIRLAGMNRDSAPDNSNSRKRSAGAAGLDEEEDEQKHDEVRLWEDGFKERYYESKFEVSQDNLEFRYRVALQYVRGLCWVLRYYYQGCASWKWYFPYPPHSRGSPECLILYRVALQYVRGLCWVLRYYYQGCASWKWYFPYPPHPRAPPSVLYCALGLLHPATTSLRSYRVALQNVRGLCWVLRYYYQGCASWKWYFPYPPHPRGSPECLILYRVALQYVRGLCWVLRYYYQGCASWKWYFPYHYAPFASDFVNIGGLATAFETGTEPFRPLEQLMGVFPAASSTHVPKPWAKLMSDPFSPIIDFYPTDFKIDLNGKKFAWQGVALLPFVEENRLFKALEPYYGELTAAERQRNIRGNDRLYVDPSNPAYQFLLGLYSGAGGELRGRAGGEQQHPLRSEGVRGQLMLATENVPINGQLNSPVVGLPPVLGNQVVCVRFVDPEYPEDFIFPARRLPGATEPLRVLKPGDLSQQGNRNWRPQIDLRQLVLAGPEYPEDFIFPARRLPGATEPLRVLKPGDLSQQGTGTGGRRLPVLAGLEYPEDFIFPARRLPGATEPLRVLKPGDLSQQGNRNWRPQIGMVPSNTLASLDAAGHRMLGHQLPRDRSYSHVPPPQQHQNQHNRDRSQSYGPQRSGYVPYQNQRHQGDQGYNQGNQGYNQGRQGYNQGGQNYNQGGHGYNQGGQSYNQGQSYNRGGHDNRSGHDNRGSQDNRGSRHNQGGFRHQSPNDRNQGYRNNQGYSSNGSHGYTSQGGSRWR
ncbi:unnamed protein product [Plutella xylostella]|uniref:5'-3' exoribonuclease n=1 Tax=Plutella xylostella TaxID=51655 RepID=A0A8S4FLE9_PLUXY|nr:unnamed protein product [Plutella xylostella]